MLTYAKRIGYFGENKTAVYLREKGYKILAGNFHSDTGEIDIIAENEDYICFVEVKTRSADALLPPREAVDGKKEDNIRKTASYFRSKYKSEKESRFDICEIYVKNFEDYLINYIENSF